eukprot:g33181.t1
MRASNCAKKQAMDFAQAMAFLDCNIPIEKETQKEPGLMFYPKRAAFSSLSEKALKTILRYQKQPVSTPKVSTLLKGQKKLYIVAISYAHGCCAKSLKRNRDQALRVGVDEARSYGKQDLGPDWVAKNSQDPAVPWDTGVVLWVDAGNYLHADPRPVLHEALEESDILALRLKQCLESDWTSQLTLLRMNVSSRYSLLDRPQLGAYFLAFRKTKAVMAFVENWLRLCEDRRVGAQDEETLLGLQARQTPGGPEVEEDLPTFMTHQADQSIFSILFKSHGFRATPLEVGHRAVTLDRWREHSREPGLRRRPPVVPHRRWVRPPVEPPPSPRPWWRGRRPRWRLLSMWPQRPGWRLERLVRPKPMPPKQLWKLLMLSLSVLQCEDVLSFWLNSRDCPSEVGRQTMRAMRAIPGQEEDASHAIRAAQSAVTEVLLLSGEAEATIRQAKIDADTWQFDLGSGQHILQKKVREEQAGQ